MSCISCNSNFSNKQFNLGKQFKCSDFIKSNDQIKKVSKFKLDLVYCEKCNLIQFKKPIKYLNLLPRFRWMINKEEDKYHSQFVRMIINKKIISKNLKILGISNYDLKFIDTLKNYGYKNVEILNLKNHLKIKNQIYSRQEVIQNYLSKSYADNFLKSKQKVDLIICSKILEHSQNIKEVFLFFKKILKKNGAVIIDVPDSKKSLVQGNISMIWEEHISYFTNKTLYNTLTINGFKKVLSKIFYFKQENNLVFFYKKKKINSQSPILIKEQNLINEFKLKVITYEKRIKKLLIGLKKKNYLNVIYGAGHNSVAFINYLKLGKYFSYIIDDDKKKKNLKVYGSNLFVKNFEFIKTIGQDTAFFLGTSINLEKKIIPKLKKVKNNKIYSLYPDSNHYFNNEKNLSKN